MTHRWTRYRISESFDRSRLGGPHGLLAMLISFALLVAALTVTGPAYAGFRALHGIVVTDVSVREVDVELAEEGRTLALVLGDLFVQRLEESIAGLSPRRVWIERHLLSGPSLEDSLAKLSRSGFSVVIMPALVMSSRGMLFRARIIDLRVGSPDRALKRSVFETLPISSEGDFFAIEKLFEYITDRIARRILEPRLSGEARVRRVLYWCVFNRDLDDRRADVLSRQLTIELPYYVSKELVSRKSEIHFIGLGPKEYFVEGCSLVVG